MSRELFEACWALRGIALKVAYDGLHNAADAEDCVQETMLEMYQSRSSCDGRELGLICTATRRKTWRMLRTMRRNARAEAGWRAPVLEFPVFAERTLQAQLIQALIVSRLGILTDRQRAVVLDALAGKSTPDAEQGLRIRAIQRIRSDMRERGAA